MAGYLEKYGEGEERRIKIIKTLVISLVSLLVVGGVLFFIFHNYRQEQQVKRFFALLEQKDYQNAYIMWVRTESDRKGYSYDMFMKDWGPDSDHRDVSDFRISKSRSCGNGVILTVDFGKSQREKLWVQREELTIGYSPLPGCPAPR
ncbi:MAG TPA: hypothetical protein VKU19_00145 [Bryobacteraceae bacterium]|nr:hypothetical protein [Bryobacteraceae bacterium]